MDDKLRKVVAMRFPSWSAVGPGVTHGVVTYMRQHELWRLVTENDSYGEMEATKIDADWHGDGAVLFRATSEELAAYRKRGMAAVLTSTEGPDGGYPRVVPDNHEIGRLAAKHLVECNLTHFAFLARGETIYREAQFAPGTRVYARLRLAGFREALGEYAYEPVVHYLQGRPLWKAHSWREIQAEVMAFLDTLPEPCGIFAVDDALGAVVLRAADMLGKRVPEQLAVIGYGDDPNYCYATYPAMSSIAHPAQEVGSLAAELLQQQMDGAPVEAGSRMVPVSKVVQRESSNIIAIEDPVIRDLVAWIRCTAPAEAVRVNDLVERSKLSLTTLKSRFTAAIGHGPKHEIKRVRLAHLKHLLSSTELSLADIARQMQFASAHELSRFFTAETHQRPSDYRKALELPADDAERRAIKAVIFDMDGTLFDSETLYFEAFRDTYREQGGSLTCEQYDQDHRGTTNEAIERALCARAPAGFDAARFRRDWRQRWEALLETHGLEPLPGVCDCIERLRSAGYALAVASSSEKAEVDRCLRIAGFDACFAQRAAGDEVREGKPNPDVFLLAAKRLGVKPHECLVIEDSRAGVAAARAAGMRVMRVSSQSLGDAPDMEGVLCQAELYWEDVKQLLEQGVSLASDQACTAPLQSRLSPE